VLPNFQNPTGVTLALERRHQLVALADQYGVPIVEDDPYGQLRYEGEHLPAVVVVDGKRLDNQDDPTYRGNVIYLSTFSKILAPGIRLAWVIAPPEVIAKLVQAKQGADLHTATFNQMVAHQVSQGGFLDEHIRRIRAVYGERRDVMLAAMEEHMPPGVTWTHPEGGLFLWVKIPEGMNARKVLDAAIEQKVAFVPGTPFYPTGGGENTIRLNFSNAKPEMIRSGIASLGQVLKKQVKTYAAALP
jgi:2-aminoadipate transaminase